MALADLAGVDTTLDWPIGLKFWGTPPMIVSLFVVNITSIGEATFEALLAKTQQNPEQVSIREVQLPQDAPVEAHLKQFQAILTLAGIDLSRVELSN